MLALMLARAGTEAAGLPCSGLALEIACAVEVPHFLTEDFLSAANTALAADPNVPISRARPRLRAALSTLRPRLGEDDPETQPICLARDTFAATQKIDSPDQLLVQERRYILGTALVEAAD